MTCNHEPDLARAQQSRNPLWSRCKHCGKVYPSEYAQNLKTQTRKRIESERTGWKKHYESQKQDPVDTAQYGLGWPRIR